MVAAALGACVHRKATRNTSLRRRFGLSTGWVVYKSSVSTRAGKRLISSAVRYDFGHTTALLRRSVSQHRSCTAGPRASHSTTWYRPYSA